MIREFSLIHNVIRKGDQPIESVELRNKTQLPAIAIATDHLPCSLMFNEEPDD